MSFPSFSEKMRVVRPCCFNVWFSILRKTKQLASGCRTSRRSYVLFVNLAEPCLIELSRFGPPNVVNGLAPNVKAYLWCIRNAVKT